MYRICFLLLCICNSVSAQFKNSVWVFGDSAGIDFTNTNSPVPINTGMDGRGSSACISDSVGNLLFYAFTRANTTPRSTQVFNSQHSLMDNGDSIVGEAWYNECLIIPDPDNYKLYYLFSIATAFTGNPGLFYSIIDMNLNGGLGGVISKNNLLNNLQAFDGPIAIKHGNGRDWWLIYKTDGYHNPANNDFYIYLITPNGISTPTVQSTGFLITTNAGCITFNKQGNKLLMTNLRNLIQLFVFDRCLGTMSNPIIVESENQIETGSHWGNSFSPDGNLFYVSHNAGGVNYTDSWLYQFDSNAPNIAASRETLNFSSAPIQHGALRLAPDDKIYMTSAYYGYSYPYPDSVYYAENMHLSVINKPDSVGSACDFQPYSFYLGGKRTYYGLPNNPNYEMGSITGSICDSLGVGIKIIENTQPQLHVFYNSNLQAAFINAEKLTVSQFELAVFDISGRKIFEETGTLSFHSFTKDLNCAGIAKGLYIITLVTDDQKINQRLLIN